MRPDVDGRDKPGHDDLRKIKKTGLDIQALRQQHRVRAVHGLRRIGHGLLQRGRLHRNVLGEEARQRDIALAIAFVAGGQCLACEIASAERRAEQAKIGRCTGKRIVRRGGEAFEQPAAGARQRCQSLPQFCACLLYTSDAADE